MRPTHAARRRGVLRFSTKLLGAALAFGVLAAVVAGASASCSQTPVNVPVRTFEQPQKVDVVCMQINDQSGNPLRVDQLQPVPPNECSPVPNGADGPALPNHLYAVVTQVTRGELGVVDLTAGWVIDEDKATPGTNFIPVGANPTDVRVAPDGAFTFVSSADLNKPAIYAIDNHRLLGDSTGLPVGGAMPAPLRLTDLTACALPQPPQALAVATRKSPPRGASPYVLMAVLRTWAGNSAKVVAIDPTPLIGGGGTPGALPACSVLGATQLSTALPGSWQPGPTWPDGVPYVDGGVDVEVPSLGPSCGTADASPAGPADAGTPDSGTPDAGDGGLPLSLGPLDAPRPTSIALRDDDVHVLYVADAAVPVIHVIDVSDPTAPRELPPLLATSVVDPSRQVAVGDIAISPPTRDYKRYLYAVDSGNGTLMVFDVTDPATSPRMPLRRPHAELNPFQDPDRILFSAPVATVAFVEHDWPAPSQGKVQPPINQYTGVLCNPNQNALSDAGVQSIGALYRADQAGQIQAGGTPEGFPNRLRGVFGFATLANGNVVAIDVDDWDAPCRRPDPMQSDSMTGVLDLPQQPPTGPNDLDPYHAPVVFNQSIGTAGVTEEAFFPVSAPNRLRSNFLLSNDPTSGLHVPNLLGLPQLFDVNGAPVAVTGASATSKPIMLPTALPPNFVDPSYLLDPTAADPSQRNPTSNALASSGAQTAATFLPGTSTTSPPAVRISFDDPTAHIDQDWTVTYEGALPTVSGIAANMTTTDGYQSLILAAPNAGFCARGIEDAAIGQARAGVVLAVLNDPKNGLATSGVKDPMVNPSPAPLDQWTSDYVEIADDLAAQGDPYWSVPTKDDRGQPLNDCWDGSLADDSDPNIANNRFYACQQVFDMSWDADTHLARDFPIVQAYDDHLIVTRFAWDPGTPEQTTSRVVVPHPDPSNAPFLRFATCCFHRQATFKVRTGGEWVANGTNNVGLLHHVVADASGRCVLSCDPQYALLNARAFDVPWSNPASAKGCGAPQGPSDLSLLDRDSPLAMRNPMFSFIVWSGCGTGGKGDHTLTPRDYQWRFSMSGGFNPVSISLTQGNTGSSFVSPQSMLFIGALGQLAVVDGAQQGLVLIDLNSLTFAHSPYF